MKTNFSKEILKEKLEIIVDGISKYESQKNGIDNIIEENYKKAFLLSKKFFPKLHEIIRCYELSVKDRGCVTDMVTGKRSTVYSREEEYSKFLKQVEVEVEKINKM